MKIHFKISYHTHWGQKLLVRGNIPQLGSNQNEKAFELNFQHPDVWSGEIDVDNIESVSYNYVLLDEPNGRYTDEWGDARNITVSKNSYEHYFCFDQWNPAAALENTFLTAPFQEVLLKNNNPHAVPTPNPKATHSFVVQAPVIDPKLSVCIIGSCDELGAWSTRKPKLLQMVGNGTWAIDMDLSKVKADLQYKYGLYDAEDKSFCYFENGPNRTASIINAKKTKIAINDGFLNMPVKQWRGAGVGLPVFSIRTKNSFGVGDFEDIKLFVDWACKVGLKLIQVLPLNDTIGTHTDADVLPYAAISAFALNPLFLHLPSLDKIPASNDLTKEYKKLQPQLNAESLVPFLDVVNFKLKYAREAYKLNKEKFLKNAEYHAFYSNNEYWLKPYAVYCVLRDKFGTSDYRLWKEFANFDASQIEAFGNEAHPDFDEVAVNYYIQFHLHLQLQNATRYAHDKGVVLKGDIPIGVNRNSVDTWTNPELFNMDMNAGAPPDMFAVKGQNWELPTYNWEAIKRTNFDWWKKRFAQMSNYFDTFRVDHILGFFRIWQIPTDQIEGIMGHLQPSIAVHINEFSEKGLWFDKNRYCKPYITDDVLWQLFGDDTSWIKANCLQIEDGWVLRLKKVYQSQAQVEQMFNDGLISEKIKWGLFDLISNVLFFEMSGSNGTWFYPRYGMESLSTFQALDEYSKSKLREIYVDYFYRRQDAHWYKTGMEKLPALKRSTNMLICGEDLGMMTHCVTTVMNELGILSLEVQRAPKSDKIEFFHPADAPYLSVVTPSTHDMSTIRGWWEEDRAVTQRFYNTQLGHWGEAPYFCDWWICRDILLQHLYSPAMWAIFQMQDLLSISDKVRRENPNEERINVPSNSKFSWRYRLHINMEDLIENDEFNDELRNYILHSGR